jgi:radical SAM protein with 4Fe4S-binding SPASM domain
MTFLCLSKNAFVRNFGPYTYLFNQLNKYDQLYENGDNFIRWITRSPVEKQKVITHIISAYPTTDKKQIEDDFDEFLTPLLEAKIVIAGSTERELQINDPSFTYNVDDPHTAFDFKEYSDAEKKGMVPQETLNLYFREHPTIFRMHLDITHACTERCVHCYVPEYDAVFLPYEKICEVLDEYRDMCGFSVTLSGGECMLHPDFDAILRYTRQKDFTVSILSNLTRCTDSRVQLLKEMNLSELQVSLYSMDPYIHDSITQRPGSWTQTMDAIERLYAADVPLQISCPTMKQNFEGYTAVKQFAHSKKMKAYTDYIMMAKANHDTSNLAHRLTLDQTKELLRDVVNHNIELQQDIGDEKYRGALLPPEVLAERPICSAGTDSICLNASGQYYACSGFQDYPLGNCYHSTLRNIWENSESVKYLRSLRGKDIPTCTQCENRNYCSVCLVRNFNETGDMLNVPEHFCRVADLNRVLVDEYYQTHRSQ